MGLHFFVTNVPALCILIDKKIHLFRNEVSFPELKPRLPQLDVPGDRGQIEHIIRRDVLRNSPCPTDILWKLPPFFTPFFLWKEIRYLNFHHEICFFFYGKIPMLLRV